MGKCLRLCEFWLDSTSSLPSLLCSLTPNTDMPVMYSRGPLFCSCNLCFAVIWNVFIGPFNFLMSIMYCLARYCVTEISNSLRFTFLECLQREQFWDKMASAESIYAIYIFTALKEGIVLTQNGICWDIACFYMFCRVLLSPSIGQQSN
jgi:hypothetical protein